MEPGSGMSQWGQSSSQFLLWGPAGHGYQPQSFLGKLRKLWPLLEPRNLIWSCIFGTSPQLTCRIPREEYSFIPFASGFSCPGAQLPAEEGNQVHAFRSFSISADLKNNRKIKKPLPLIPWNKPSEFQSIKFYRQQ